MNHQTFTLHNGLKVIFIDTEAFPTLTTLLLIGAGSRYENEKNNGIAHFFEHMAFKGSKKYPSSLIISSTIEGLGGVFNAFTSKDHTGYWIKSTTAHFSTVVDVLSDMVLNPLLIEEEINKEKGVIIEEINLYEDMPYRKVNDVFDELLYDGNPLGFDIAGTKKSVNSFSRQTFLDYIRSLYTPTNAILVVAGGLFKNGKKTIKEYLKIIEEKLSQWQGEKKINFEKVFENQCQPQISIKNKKTEQAHFCLGFRTFSFFNQRRFALSVLSVILGGGMSSRLFTEVREKRGLCYYISTGRELYHDVGNIVTQAGIANSLDKVKQAIEIILKEHNKVAKGDIKKEELKNAKELIKGRLLLSMEDSFNVAASFGERKLLEDIILTPQKIIKEIERINIDEITSLAKEIFTPKVLNFAMIGPFEKDDIKLDNLNFLT